MSEIVGIKFCSRPPEGIGRVNTKDKHCHFIGRGRREAFYIRSEDIDCPLARFYLGIGQTDIEDLSRTLVSWDDASDIITARSHLETGIRLGKSSQVIAYFPYPAGDIKPDVLVVIGTAQEIKNMVQKSCARTGERIKASLSGIGAACGECTAYPLVTGRANLSVGCNGSRPGIGLKNGELLLAFPADSKLSDTIVRNIER